MLPTFVADFSGAWEALGTLSEVQETFQMNSPSLIATVNQLIKILGMQPLEGSGQVMKEKNSHILVLAGVFLGGIQTLVRVRMAYDPSSQVVAMQFAVRAATPDVSALVANAVQG
jgi:coatomer protein complex subunit gamma